MLARIIREHGNHVMEDLSYILNLGFSGTDVWRAVLISFLLAMFVSKKRPLFGMAVICAIRRPGGLADCWTSGSWG